MPSMAAQVVRMRPDLASLPDWKAGVKQGILLNFLPWKIQETKQKGLAAIAMFRANGDFRFFGTGVCDEMGYVLLFTF